MIDGVVRDGQVGGCGMLVDKTFTCFFSDKSSLNMAAKKPHLNVFNQLLFSSYKLL